VRHLLSAVVIGGCRFDACGSGRGCLAGAVQSSILDRDAVRRVVALLVEAEEALDAASPAATSARSALRVVDAFLVPRFHYDPIKKVFYEYVNAAFSLWIWAFLHGDLRIGSFFLGFCIELGLKIAILPNWMLNRDFGFMVGYLMSQKHYLRIWIAFNNSC
jgi:hypothetical protein